MKRTVNKAIWILDRIDVAIILTDLKPVEIAELGGITIQAVMSRINTISKRYKVKPDIYEIRKTVPKLPEFKKDLLLSLLSGKLGISVSDVIKYIKLIGDTDESISNKDEVKISKN